MAVSNPVFTKNMKRLFGEELFNQLSEILDDEAPKPVEREKEVTEKICQRISLIDEEIISPLHYRFRDEYGTRTTHHLFFATKHPLGYAKMKEIMMNQSSEVQEGVGMMEFNKKTAYQPRLIVDFSIQHLKAELLKKFAGKSLSVRDIYFQHNIGRPYIEKNYKEAIRQLETERMVSLNPAADKRKIRLGIITVPDRTLVNFQKP